MRSEMGGGTAVASISANDRGEADGADEVQSLRRERDRLALELHDVLAQNIQHVLLQLDAARGVLGPGAALACRHVITAQERMQECWDELRDCIQSLRPPPLARGNLIAGLAHDVAALSETAPAAIAFEVCGTPYPVARGVEGELLRIAQEAVVNALRHAGAKRIAIELSFDADALRLTVTDNGCGFEVGPLISGYGLCGMRERAMRIEAELFIDSQRGRGTEIRASVPRAALDTDEKADRWQSIRRV